METFVSECIANTKRIVPDYWNATLAGRLNGGAGSSYDQFETAEALEQALKDANWQEITHPDVMVGCRVFKANIPGRFGLVEIDNLPDDTVLVADDRKGTGHISIVATGTKGQIVEDTYLIVGEEQGENVVFTFHPGEPVRPSVVETASVSHGTRLTKAEAKKLGFDLAKIG